MRRGRWTSLALALMASLVVVGPAMADEVEWRSGSLDEAFAAAQQQGKPLMAFFWWEGSEHAEAMRHDALAHPAIAERLADFVCYDANHRAPGVAALFQEYAIQVSPSALFFTAAGEPEELIMGAVGAHDLERDLERIAAGGEGTISHMRKVAAETKDVDEAIEMLMNIAGKYGDFGQRERHDATLVSICELDPKASTLGGCRAHVMRWRQELYAGLEQCEGECAEADCADGSCEEAEGECEAQAEKAAADKARTRELAANWDLDPVYALAKKARLPEAKFEVWDALVGFETTRGDEAKVLAALREAARSVPEDQAGDWCQGAAQKVMRTEGKLKAKDRKFALELARRASQIAEQKRRDAQGHEEEWNAYLGSQLETLARALHLNGKKKDALEVCTRAVELHPCEQTQATLVSIKG